MSAHERTTPLDGIVVLDLSRIIAGPLATQILADFGADVIKVEDPATGDPSRTYLADGDAARVSPLFENLNRNKRSIGIDLKSPAGLTLLRELVAGADVLIHNFRPGVAERLGVDEAALSAINPDLVHCAISGFGDVGPRRTSAANDVIVQAYSGIMSFTGEPGGEPVRCGPSVADFSTGLYAAIGVLVALLGRERTGRVESVSTSLLECCLSMVAHNLTEYDRTGLVVTPMGSGTRVGLPNAAYPCSDGEVLIAAVDDRNWRRLCHVLGLDELADDERFRDLPARRAHRAELDAAITGVTSAMTAAECLERLDREGIPCAPVHRIDQVMHDPQVSALDILSTIHGHQGVDVRVVRSPLRLDGHRPDVRSPAPELGQHAGEVTPGRLGSASHPGDDVAPDRLAGGPR